MSFLSILTGLERSYDLSLEVISAFTRQNLYQVHKTTRVAAFRNRICRLSGLNEPQLSINFAHYSPTKFARHRHRCACKSDGLNRNSSPRLPFPAQPPWRPQARSRFLAPSEPVWWRVLRVAVVLSSATLRDIRVLREPLESTHAPPPDVGFRAPDTLPQHRTENNNDQRTDKLSRRLFSCSCADIRRHALDVGKFADSEVIRSTCRRVALLGRCRFRERAVPVSSECPVKQRRDFAAKRCSRKELFHSMTVDQRGQILKVISRCWLTYVRLTRTCSFAPDFACC